MPLGYCPVCTELVTIVKAPPVLPGERETWKTLDHEAHGVRCRGSGRRV